MARNTNQRSINDYVGGPNPGPAPSNEIIDSAVYDSNVTAALDILAARPQKAIRTANDIVFASPRHDAARGVTLSSSPEPFGVAGGRDAGARGDTRFSKIVGDMVTGAPQDGYSAQGIVVDLGADLATGGEPDGPLSANRPGSQNFYRSVPDFPGGQGSGTVPMEPRGYDNPA